MQEATAGYSRVLWKYENLGSVQVWVAIWSPMVATVEQCGRSGPGEHKHGFFTAEVQPALVGFCGEQLLGKVSNGTRFTSG